MFTTVGQSRGLGLRKVHFLGKCERDSIIIILVYISSIFTGVLRYTFHICPRGQRGRGASQHAATLPNSEPLCSEQWIPFVRPAAGAARERRRGPRRCAVWPERPRTILSDFTIVTSDFFARFLASMCQKCRVSQIEVETWNDGRRRSESSNSMYCAQTRNVYHLSRRDLSNTFAPVINFT